MIRRKIYLIGSLRNETLPMVANKIEEDGWSVFADWFAAGKIADDSWRDYEKLRGHSYIEALKGHPAKNVFDYDMFHINTADAGVLVLPAGKSGYLELGNMSGQGKPTFILADEVPERYDVMVQFANGGIYFSIDELKKALKNFDWPLKLCDTPDIYFSDAMWLAGLMEGEGSFSFKNGGGKPRPRLTLAMTDFDVMEKACRLMKCKLYGPYKRAQKKSDGSSKKEVYTTGLAGPIAVEWMKILKPYMGVRRKAQIDAVLSSWVPEMYGKWKKKKAKNDE